MPTISDYCLLELMNIDFLIRYIIETDQLLKDGCILQTLLYYDLRLQCVCNLVIQTQFLNVNPAIWRLVVWYVRYFSSGFD